MSEVLRVLVIEDSEDDAELLLRELRHGGYNPQFKRVDTAVAVTAALDSAAWDLIISDYIMPGFGGLAALEIYKERGLDVPFIVLSGRIGEDMAVRLMKGGAHDCIMKDHLARVVPAVARELRDAEVRRERREAARALREEEARFRQLAENIDSAFFMFERDEGGQFSRLLYASAAYEKIWGRTRESLYMDPGSWLKAVHPKDQNEVRKNLPTMERGEFKQEFRILGADAKERWVHYRTFPVLNTKGEVYRIAGIADDVTERKAAEQQLAENERQIAQMVEELRTIEEQLKDSNQAIWDSRKELDRRVHERTAGLEVANAELQSQIRARAQLEGELLEIAERERRRRGLDTHNTLSQKLMGVSFMLKALERKVVHKHLPYMSETRQIQTLIDEVINHSDGLAHDFSALESRGNDLARELKGLASKVRKTFQISCQFSVKGTLPKLQENTTAQLYKITLEALCNAIKHGNATSISLNLVCDSAKVLLVVSDNGLPMARIRDANHSAAWHIMNSRASMIGASLQMQPHAGQGMVVTCIAPILDASQVQFPLVIAARQMEQR